MRWDITDDTLDQLKNTQGLSPGGLFLSGKKLKPASARPIADFIRQSGQLLHQLDLDFVWSLGGADEGLGALDYAAVCPHLTDLILGRVRVNASLFAHPKVDYLELDECRLSRTLAALVLGAAGSGPHPLARLVVRDSPTARQFTFGPGSAIRRVQLEIDEDCSDYMPNDLLFDGCAELDSIDVRSCATWAVTLKGVLPSLKDVSLETGRYGAFAIDAAEVDDASSEYARDLKARGSP